MYNNSNAKQWVEYGIDRHFAKGGLSKIYEFKKSKSIFLVFEGN
jgi:hypothetical protein